MKYPEILFESFFDDIDSSEIDVAQNSKSALDGNMPSVYLDKVIQTYIALYSVVSISERLDNDMKKKTKVEFDESKIKNINLYNIKKHLKAVLDIICTFIDDYDLQIILILKGGKVSRDEQLFCEEISGNIDSQHKFITDFCDLKSICLKHYERTADESSKLFSMYTCYLKFIINFNTDKNTQAKPVQVYNEIGKLRECFMQYKKKYSTDEESLFSSIVVTSSETYNKYNTQNKDFQHESMKPNVIINYRKYWCNTEILDNLMTMLYGDNYSKKSNFIDKIITKYNVCQHIEEYSKATEAVYEKFGYDMFYYDSQDEEQMGSTKNRYVMFIDFQVDFKSFPGDMTREDLLREAFDYFVADRDMKAASEYITFCIRWFTSTKNKKIPSFDEGRKYNYSRDRGGFSRVQFETRKSYGSSKRTYNNNLYVYNGSEEPFKGHEDIYVAFPDSDGNISGVIMGGLKWENHWCNIFNDYSKRQPRFDKKYTIKEPEK